MTAGGALISLNHSRYSAPQKHCCLWRKHIIVRADAANALTYLNSARTYANNVYGSNLSAYVAGDLSAVRDGNAKLLQAILNEQYLATGIPD